MKSSADKKQALRLRPAQPSSNALDEAAVLLWRDMVAGRAVVIGHRDQGGRRYLTLEPSTRASASSAELLTERERQAVGYRAYGQSLKRIAAELGVSEPTVTRDLARARRKLGIVSDLELPAIFTARPRPKCRG